MNIYGYELTEEVQKKALKRLNDLDVFTHPMLVEILIDLGVPKETEAAKRTNLRAHEAPAYRGADRMIQKLRKCGEVAFNQGIWRWI